MNISSFKIKFSTERAHLLEKDGVRIWCAKSCIKKDGTLHKIIENKFFELINFNNF